MSDVKRGAPTEDGVYIVKVPKGERIIEMRHGNAFWLDDGCCNVPYYEYPDILAHRKHVPLTVPPLKELPKPDMTLVVVETGMGNVYAALRHTDIKGWHIWKDNHWISWPFAKELTREQCEAAGYAWPENCK